MRHAQFTCQLQVCVRPADIITLRDHVTWTHSRSVIPCVPVSVHRLLSVSELVSQQRLACVSNLSWNTNRQRAWAREAELSLPGQHALPRVNLLLIGCLRAGLSGEWRLTDGSGTVRCEVRQGSAPLVSAQTPTHAPPSVVFPPPSVVILRPL